MRLRLVYSFSAPASFFGYWDNNSALLNLTLNVRFGGFFFVTQSVYFPP